MNIELLRKDLLNYFCDTGTSGGYTTSLMNVFKIKHASKEELIQFAKKAGFDLRRYEK